MVASGYMLAMGGLADNEKLGRQMAEAALASGKAFSRFRDFIQAQGGDVKYVDNPDFFDRARFIQGVESPHSGYLAEINAREAGETSVLLGCGRTRKDDPIDYSVGVIVHHKVGDKVTKGDVLFTYNDDINLCAKMLAA
jgi:pyrimidine-nucleoside phosphorylase